MGPALPAPWDLPAPWTRCPLRAALFPSAAAGAATGGNRKPMRSPGWLARAALLALLAPPARGQLVTENAGILSPETPLLRQSLSWFESRNLSELRLTSQLLFAPSPTRELKLGVPLLARDLRLAQGTQEELRGLGDASLRFKQSLWQRDDVMESTRWALLAELGAPTGQDDAEADGEPLPRRLQLGTGDWSLGAGSAYTWIRDRQRFSAELFHRHRTRHDGLQLGASSEANLAYWYRLSPAQFPAHRLVGETRGVLELLSTYRFASATDAGRGDDDGLISWLAPGIQYFPGSRALFEAGFQVPLYQDLDDALGRRKWAATLTLKLLF
jgi:hypothetical protein